MEQEKDKLEASLLANRAQIIPDSHFWTDLDQLLQYLEFAKLMHDDVESLANYIAIGLKNTKEKGFKLKQ